MTLSPWLVLLLAVPVLLLGEWCVRKCAPLRRFNIPPAVAGGLIVCVAVLVINISGLGKLALGSRVNEGWWTWIVCAEPEWAGRPMRPINTFFMVGFFACVGLNATWSVIRKGGVQLLLFWLAATVLAGLQNLVGAGLSVAMGESPLLGIMCGSVTLSGGHSTAQAFAEPFAKAGLQGAAVIGVAAATFGLVAGSLLGGPVAARLIEKHKLKSPWGTGTAGTAGMDTAAVAIEEPGFFSLLRALRREGTRLLAPMLVILLCVKGGAWLAYLFQQAALTAPVSMCAMLMGLMLRNLHDVLGLKWLDSDVIDALSAVLLSVFLTITMAGLNLIELAATAAPMAVILFVQVAMMGAFALYVTYRTMGRDYDAAVMAAGHCGFGLGATANAVATMLTVVQRYGPARRAFLIVPPAGGVLIDITNITMVPVILNWLS